MDRKFITKLVIVGGMAVLFLVMLIPYLFVSTPLHVYVRVARTLSEKHGVRNALVSAKTDDKGKLSLIEIHYESSPEVFMSDGRREAEMRRILRATWEEFDNINAEIEKENREAQRKYREEVTSGSYGARLKQSSVFRPAKFAVIARLESPGGCARGESEEKRLEYPLRNFENIKRFSKYADSFAAKVKSGRGIEAEIKLEIANFPGGPFGLTVTCKRVEGGDNSAVLREAADWIKANWSFPPVPLQWVEVTDESSGLRAISGRKPGEKQPAPQKPAPPSAPGGGKAPENKKR